MRSRNIQADILAVLSDGKIHTTYEIAEEVETSQITVKRHIQDLAYRYNIKTFHGGDKKGGVRLVKNEISLDGLSNDDLQRIIEAIGLLQNPSMAIKVFAKRLTRSKKRRTKMKNLNKTDDSKQLVVIDYYDRIHGQWIKVEVTKEVARFLQSSKKKMRRDQNKYDYYTEPYCDAFNRKKPENEKFLVDEHSDPEIVLEEKEKEKKELIENEYQRTIVENSLYILTPEQREVVEKIFYENKTEDEIASEINRAQSTVSGRKIRAQNKIKNFIKSTEN